MTGYWGIYCGTSIKGYTVQQELLMQPPTPKKQIDLSSFMRLKKAEWESMPSECIYMKVLKRQKDKDLNPVSGDQNLREGEGYWLQKTPDMLLFFVLFEFLVAFYILMLVSVTLLHIFVQTHQTIYLKSMITFVCKSYINKHKKTKL